MPIVWGWFIEDRIKNEKKWSYGLFPLKFWGENYMYMIRSLCSRERDIDL